MGLKTRLTRRLCHTPLGPLLLPREERTSLAVKRENFRRCDRNIAARDPDPDSAPLLLQLEVTNHCNLKCVMCPRLSDTRYLEHQSGFEGTMTYETFRRLEPILPRVTKCLLFGNGEPLMNPDLVAMLQTLARHRIDVCFNSNGTMMSERFSRTFVELGVGGITFSIDGATAPTYNAIRIGSDFDRVVGNIRRLAELRASDPERKGKPHITIACVLMSANAHEIPDMVDLTHDLGAKILHFEPLLWADSPLYDQKVHSKYKLSLVPIDRLADGFEVARRRARRKGIRIVGPYVDTEGRFVPSSVGRYDPTFEEGRE